MKAQAEKAAYARYLRDLRISLGMDQDVFAGKIGVSTKTLQNVEQGGQNLGRAAQLAVERLASAEGREGPATSADPAEMIATFVVDEELREQAKQVGSITGMPLKDAVEMLVRQRLIKG